MSDIVSVTPAFAFELPLRPWALDGLWQFTDTTASRALRIDGELVAVTACQPRPDQVLLRADSPDAQRAARAVAQARWLLGVDDDLVGFHRAYRTDPHIGRLLRAWPTLRVRRRPPMEALVWAVCEQLIEYREAAAIQRALTARLGETHEPTGLRCPPTAQALAAAGAAELEACGLSSTRALLVRRLAGMVASGRLDLGGNPADGVYRQLRQIPGVGSWTVAMFALHGRGDLSACPSADVNLMKICGRILTGRPQARASEQQVHELLTGRYGPYAGLAATYFMSRRARRSGGIASTPSGPRSR